MGFEPDAGTVLDIDQSARDQILSHMRMRFPGHDFARLVEPILKVDGYFNWRLPGCTDGHDSLTRLSHGGKTHTA